MTGMKRTINIGGEKVEIPAMLNRNTIVLAIVVIFAIILLVGSIYQIGPEEMGIVLRFGEFVRTTDPGLHLKIPLGIESLEKVPVQRQLKMEFGFRTARAGIRTQYATTSESIREAQMLTGDLNVAIVEWIVQYKIRDPYKFLFKIRDAESTFRYMNEAVVRRIVGDNSVDEVITVGRARIAMEARGELQQLCDLYEIGIEVNQRILSNLPLTMSMNRYRRRRGRSMRPGQITTT